MVHLSVQSRRVEWTIGILEWTVGKEGMYYVFTGVDSRERLNGPLVYWSGQSGRIEWTIGLLEWTVKKG